MEHVFFLKVSMEYVHPLNSFEHGSIYTPKRMEYGDYGVYILLTCMEGSVEYLKK